jgi:hypothetical protein
MATHTFVDDYPSNHNSNWTENLQGVTHDSEHWFFTQEEKLWKIHARRDLNADPITVDDQADMPGILDDLGCNHFGDPDHFEHNGQGYLFIPVEGDDDCGKKPIVAVFRNEQGLPFIGHQALENETLDDNARIGWCAINPTNGLLYTSHNEINDKLPIFRYQVDWDALENNQVIITPESNMTLWQTPARQNHVQIPKYVQGGAFSLGGKLYIVGGKAIKPLIWKYIPTFLIPLIIDLFEDEGGIFVFDLFDDAGEAFGCLDVKSSLTDTPFLYEYHPGYWKSEEPEGLTHWDIDGLDFQVPGIEGQLHAILLDNNTWPADDEIYFKHYRIE